MELQEVQSRIAALSNKTKWGAGLLVALLLGPLLYFVGYALFGVAYAATAALAVTIIGMVFINVIPVLAFKFANWKLRALKAEAAKSPIETLENQQIEIEAELKKTKDAITDFDAEIETFRQTLATEVENGHPEAAEAGLPVLENMERILEFRRIKYKQTARQVRERDKRVKSAKAKFRVAMAAQKVTAASGETQNRLRAILEEVAFESVDREVGTSMAELRSALMAESVPEGESTSYTIEMPVVEDQRKRNTQLLTLLRSPRDAAADETFALPR